MKSFLGGLALASTMALLGGTATPQSSVCLLFPRFEAATVEVVDGDLSHGVHPPRRSLKRQSRAPRALDP